MDNEDEEDIADEAEETNGMVVVSTIIGARTVTLETVQYAISSTDVKTETCRREKLVFDVMFENLGHQFID